MTSLWGDGDMCAQRPSGLKGPAWALVGARHDLTWLQKITLLVGTRQSLSGTPGTPSTCVTNEPG